MLKIDLTKNEKLALELRHKQARDSRESDRLKVVLLRSEGWSTRMIAQALRKDESTIVRHLNDYLNDEKLLSTNGGSKGYLDNEQSQLLVTHLSGKIYTQVSQIGHYIKTTWGVQFSVSGLTQWLHQKGFSYKKPKGIPHKFDVEKQAQFIEKYEALKAELSEGEALLFMDAVHPTQATKITSGWIKTGVDKPIETTGSRTRLNIIGAIELTHIEEAIIGQYDTVNGDSIIEFFHKIRAHYSEKTVHLVLGGAGYHKSKAVLSAADKLGIKLHTLPPYSPNLNPIERLWKVMNEKVRNNQYFSTAKDFKNKISEFFEKILPEIGADLGSRINDNFQQLNRAP